MKKKVFDCNRDIAMQLGEGILPRPSRSNLLNSAVIRRGVAAALHHFNAKSVKHSSQNLGFDFQILNHKSLQNLGVTNYKIPNNKSLNWIMGKSGIDDCYVVALVTLLANRAIYALHDAYIWQEGQKRIKELDFGTFCKIFQIPSKDEKKIFQASNGRLIHFQKSRKRVAADSKVFPCLMDLSIQNIGEILAQVVKFYGPLSGSALAQSFNRGRHPEHTLVPYGHLIDVPHRYTCDEGLNKVNIPVYEFSPNKTTSHFSLDKKSILLSPSGNIKVPFHPVTIQALELNLTNKAGVFHCFPTASTRTLLIEKSSLPSQSGKGNIVKTSLLGMISNQIRLISPDELFTSRAMSTIFAKNIAKGYKTPPEVTLLLDTESVSVSLNNTHIAAIIRRWPGLGKNEFLIPGLALYTLLPKEYGTKPLIVQVFESMLQEKGLSPTKDTQAILALTKKIIIDPVVKAFDWALGCKGNYIDPDTGRAFKIRGTSLETHAQNVEWIAKVYNDKLQLQPRIVIKDFATSVIKSDAGLEQKVKKVVRQWDVRLGDFLMEPIFQALANNFSVKPGELRQLLVESFIANVKHKELFLAKGKVFPHIVNDLYYRTWGKYFSKTFSLKKSKQSPSESLHSWPPLYRPENISGYH